MGAVTGGGSSFPLLPILGGVGLIAAVIGVLGATGRLPWMSGSGSSGGTASASIASTGIGTTVSPEMLDSMGLTPESIGTIVETNLDSLAGSITANLANVLGSLQPTPPAAPPSGGGGLHIGGGGPMGLSGGGVPSAALLESLGITPELIQGIVGENAGAVTGNILSNIHDAVGLALSGAGGGAGSSTPSLGPTLPPGTDLAQLGVTAGHLQQIVDDSLSTMSGNVLSGIQSAIDANVDIASVLSSDAIRQVVGDSVGSVSGNLVSGIQSAASAALPPAPEP